MQENKRWNFPEEKPIPQEFLSAIGGHPLVAQTLYIRGFQTIEAAQAFLHPENYQPTPGDQLPDVDQALPLLIDAINQNKHILVWGDFDVDGQTATTLLVEALRELGGFVNYHIPVRKEESHGITRNVLESYLGQGFDLLLTCDTGISEHENIQLVRNAGIPVIVTDHHSLGGSLPPANALINPQRLSHGHPLQDLPGVGVAYKLMEALFDELGYPFNQGHYQELAALGIVADLAQLEGDTRYILQKGLESLRSTNRMGLQTLFKNADLNPGNLDENHIGFQIAPRLNAVGRLGDANPIIEFLTTEDPGRVRVLGFHIEAMNGKRRFETRNVDAAAESLLEMSPEDRHAPAILLHHSNWPGGVVGIVASRLVERYHKPVILLTGEDPIHGSARSVEGIDITQAIAAHADLLTSYGGHPMAAGLSLPAGNLKAFKRSFLSTIRDVSDGLTRIPELTINGVIRADEISLEFVEQVSRLTPFGPGNPPLNFMIPNLSLISVVNIGGFGEHRQVIAEDTDQNRTQFIWWNGADQYLPEAQFDLVCRLSMSDYKGSPQVSAEWVDYRLSQQGKAELAQQHFSILDRRASSDPLHELQDFLAKNPQSLIWAEGDYPKSLPGKGRHKITRADTLVIWTAPPSQSVLNAVIRRAKPKRVIVYAIDPHLSDLEVFLERLGGLAKTTINHKAGETTLGEIASACAATEEAVRIGLMIWETMGRVKVTYEEGKLLITSVHQTPLSEVLEDYQKLLRSALGESKAFRGYFRSGKLENYLK